MGGWPAGRSLSGISHDCGRALSGLGQHRTPAGEVALPLGGTHAVRRDRHVEDAEAGAAELG
jgi:hypothetical protein